MKGCPRRPFFILGKPAPENGHEEHGGNTEGTEYMAENTRCDRRARCGSLTIGNRRHGKEKKGDQIRNDRIRSPFRLYKFSVRLIDIYIKVVVGFFDIEFFMLFKKAAILLVGLRRRFFTIDR